MNREIVNISKSWYEEWKRSKNNVVGCIVSGSYVLGTQTDESDLDLQIVLSDSNDWKERGNCLIQGMLIEYAATTERLIKKQIALDFADNQYSTARMFSTGIIIDDPYGAVYKLQSFALDQMGEPFIKLSTNEIEERKYWLWDSLDNARSSFRVASADSSLLFYNHLSLVLNIYCKYLGVEMPHLAKSYKLFTDEVFADKYKYHRLTDDDFIDLFLGALSINSNEYLSTAAEITDYVISKMGGLEIANWKLRTIINKKED